MLSTEEVSRKIAVFEEFVKRSFSEDVGNCIRQNFATVRDRLYGSTNEEQLDEIFWNAIDVAFQAEIQAASLPFTSDAESCSQSCSRESGPPTR